MSELTQAEVDAIGDRLINAIKAADVAAIRELYAPDAEIWHNFDRKNQTPEENLVTLYDLQDRLKNMDYTDIRRFPSPGGFVQQHALVGDAKGGRVNMPAIIRFFVTDGRITRLEEYLDTRQAMKMYA